jgi:hypothetical protein
MRYNTAWRNWQLFCDIIFLYNAKKQDYDHAKLSLFFFMLMRITSKAYKGCLLVKSSMYIICS